MSKSPPGVQRVVAVLNFFAEHPGQSFTFTEIVKALDLGRATCHALLAGLVEAQYLYRNRDKSYVIGPALVAVGKIANEQFSPLQATQPELRALSDRFRVVSAAVVLDGHDVIIQLRAGSGRDQAWSVPQGHRVPLRAAFAGAFFATAKPYELDKWLDELSPPPSPEEQQSLRSGIEFINQRGYACGVFNPDVDHKDEVYGTSFTGNKREYPVSLCSELTAKDKYDLAFITCPVFGHHGKVVFVLNLSGFRQPVSGVAITEMGSELRAAAERITYFVNGRSEPYPLPT